MEVINIDDYFQTSISNQASENILKESISNIISKNVKLDEIFTKLEPYLTSKDNLKRAKSIKFVSELVKQYRSSRLNSLEIEHLSSYLCSKLEDHYTVSTAALPGLHSLLIKCQPIDENEQKNSISALNSIKILKTTLNAIHVQSMAQADRFFVYDMCKFVLLSPRLIEQIKCEKYETDFIYGFIQSMDGEKDPRNLLICFECIRLICSQLNLGPFVDETFEVFACYFPIDFTPPKNDSFLITKQMLIESLRLCFASTNKFGKNTIPLLLEKLDSSVEDAQLDALDTYSKCANETYDPNDYKEFLEPLWKEFHKISMNATKNNLEEAALNAIQSMAISLSRTIQNANSSSSVSIEWFAQKALDSCLAYLDEPDLKLVWPNVKCLLSIASSSSTANLLILKNTLPSILHHYKSTNFQNQKKTYLDIMWQFVSNSLKFDSKASGVLQENIDQMLNICLENESNKHLRFQSLNGFYYLIKFDNLIGTASKLDDADTSNYETIAKKLWHSLWVSPCENDSTTAREERSRLIEIFYALIKNNDAILKWFFNALQESIVESRTEGTQGFIAGFDLIESMTSHFALNKSDDETFFGTELLLRLFEKLVSDLYDSDENSEYLSYLFESLSKVVQNLNLNYQKEPNLAKKEFEIIDSLLNLVLSEKFDKIFPQNSPISSVLCIKCSLVFKSFSLLLEKNALTETFLRNLNELYLNSPNFYPLEPKSNLDDKKKLIFYMQIIVSLNKSEFKSDCEEIFKKIELKLRNLSQDENTEINQIACQFYAGLLNKIDNNQTESYVNLFKDQLQQDIENQEAKLNERMNSLNLWIWIDKALALKEHKLYEFFTKKLIDWLDDSDLGKKASESFSTILNDDPKEIFVLTSKSASNMKLFYRQRFFNFVVDPLKQKFESKENVNIKQRLFYALSVLNMVSLLSKEIIQKQLKSMLPILLFSLTNSNDMDEKLCLSSLKSFEMLLNDCANYSDNSFLPYLQDILQKLVCMTKVQRSIEIRLLALNCLNIVALKLAPNQIIKYQKFVCKELEKCLTDRKRLCRQLAVEARNRWFLLTTKNSE